MIKTSDIDLQFAVDYLYCKFDDARALGPCVCCGIGSRDTVYRWGLCSRCVTEYRSIALDAGVATEFMASPWTTSVSYNGREVTREAIALLIYMSIEEDPDILYSL